MTTPLRIVFFGTPDLGVPSLRALHADTRFEVVAVISQPDRPQGRKQELLPTPMKAAAMELGIPVHQPEKLDTAAMELLRSFDADYFMLIAYGKLLKQEVLDIPHIAPINAHVSLLPRWRGASPIQSALLAGDKETGVTYMRMTAGMDEGPVLDKKILQIPRLATSGDIFEQLGNLAAEHLPNVLAKYAQDRQETPQNDAEATHCGKLSKEMGHIDWHTMTALDIERRWQAFTPWPGIYTFAGGKRLKLLALDAVPAQLSLQPGTVRLHEQKVFVGTAKGEVMLHTVQPEGKKAMSAADFLRGQNLSGFDLNEHTSDG